MFLEKFRKLLIDVKHFFHHQIYLIMRNKQQEKQGASRKLASFASKPVYVLCVVSRTIQLLGLQQYNVPRYKI